MLLTSWPRICQRVVGEKEELLHEFEKQVSPLAQGLRWAPPCFLLLLPVCSLRRLVMQLLSYTFLLLLWHHNTVYCIPLSMVVSKRIIHTRVIRNVDWDILVFPTYLVNLHHLLRSIAHHLPSHCALSVATLVPALAVKLSIWNLCNHQQTCVLSTKTDVNLLLQILVLPSPSLAMCTIIANLSACGCGALPLF